MSHFAKVENSIVTTVIVAEQEFIDAQEGTWLQTSYNTRGGVHYSPETHEPDGGTALRKNYAGVGFIYDAERDAFYEPQPYPSWVLSEDSCIWEAPAAYPDNGEMCVWDEETISWVAYDGWQPPIPYPDDGEIYDWDQEEYEKDNTTGWVLS